MIGTISDYGAVIHGRRWRGFRDHYGAQTLPPHYDVANMPGGYSYRVWTASNNVTIIGGPRNVGETYSQSDPVGSAIMAEIRMIQGQRERAPILTSPNTRAAHYPVPAGAASAAEAGPAGIVGALAGGISSLFALIPGVQDTRLVEAQLQRQRLREQLAQARADAAEVVQARAAIAQLQGQLARAQQQQQLQALDTTAPPSIAPWLLGVAALAAVAVVATRR